MERPRLFMAKRIIALIISVFVLIFGIGYLLRSPKQVVIKMYNDHDAIEYREGFYFFAAFLHDFEDWYVPHRHELVASKGFMDDVYRHNARVQTSCFIRNDQEVDEIAILNGNEQEFPRHFSKYPVKDLPKQIMIFHRLPDSKDKLSSWKISIFPVSGSYSCTISASMLESSVVDLEVDTKSKIYEMYLDRNQEMQQIRMHNK